MRRFVCFSTCLALAAIARAGEAVSTSPDAPAGAASATVESVRAELEAMLESDQALRRDLIALEKEHGHDSPEAKEAWARQTSIDARNIQRLEAIIAEHGWPGSTRFGPTAARAAFLVLQHADLEHQKKHLSLVRAAAAKGEMAGSSLALLEDRVRIREGEKQLYGSQVAKNAAGEWEPLPLENETNVDTLRASVGLGPLSQYLQGFAERSGGRVHPAWAGRSGSDTDRAGGELPEIKGVMVMAGRTQFVLTDPVSGETSGWLTLGNEFSGYTLTKYFLHGSRLVLTRGEERFEIGLAAAVVQDDRIALSGTLRLGAARELEVRQVTLVVGEESSFPLAPGLSFSVTPNRQSDGNIRYSARWELTNDEGITETIAAPNIVARPGSPFRVQVGDLGFELKP